MSFADYGYNIFPYNPHENDDGFEICEDCVLPSNVYEGDSGKSCYHVIIEHLIDLGSYTENELKAARTELEKYKALRLTREQAEQLRKLRRNEDIGGSRALVTINLNDSPACNDSTSHSRTVPGISLFRKSVDRSDLNYCHLDEASFRATIIQKDSEIISLKNENAAKETELRELEEQNKDLEMIVDKMKDDIDLLESSSRISHSQIESIVKQKNEEIDVARENSERLAKELQDEHQARLHVERQIEKLQTLLKEAQAIRKNLTEEVNVTKSRVQALECSNTSYLAMMKQLQKERDSLDRQNCENENEIEKLLNIIGKLEDKYRVIKTDLAFAKDELSVREQKLNQCRGQLETMEREVGKLIGDLAHCLGAGDEEVTEDVYARARQLTRGLVDVVKEHEQCRVHRENLIREIDRQKAINQGYDAGGVTEIQSANRELARLKRAVMSADNSKTQVELKRIRSDVIVRVDSRQFAKTEQACLKVASEASQALEKLDQTISEHEVYRKCESFLLLELENLQEALNGAEKTISGLDLNMNVEEVNSPFEELEEKRRKLLEESGNNSIVESVLSKQLLQRVQTSTQIVVRITTALREDSVSKMTYNKKLEEQLQQALAALNEVGVEKCQLENELNECKNQCRELDQEVEKLQAEVREKTQDLQALGEKMQARLDHFRKENDTLRKQLAASDRRYQDSRSENAALIKKSDEIIETLRKEGQNRDLKLQEYCKLNDYLTSKLEEAKAMLEQQQRAIVQETMRSVDLDGFNTRYDRMVELVREKEELAEKMDIMESQLAKEMRINEKLQNSLSRIQEENKFLEKSIESVKKDNDTMVKSRIEGVKVNLGEKCDKLLEKIENIGKFAKPCQKTSLTSCNDAVVRGLEKEIKSYKEKLRYQQKELLMKEKEIIDQNKKIEQLQKAKEEVSVEPLLKQIETLTREKSQLDAELKQTQMKYEDKLAEMHKQYKHHEMELHKSHNESIRRLEAKYEEIAREEEIGSQSWLQSLSASEVQQLHDKICKTPLCPSSMFERDLYEEQKKMTMSSKASVSSYGSKRPLPTKKVDAGTRMVKSSTTSSKPSSRQKVLVAEKDVSARSGYRR